MGDGRRPQRRNQGRLPSRRPSAELLHRPRRDPALDPDRRGSGRRLRAPVRPDLGLVVTAIADGKLPAIEVEGATKRYDRRPVLRGISFEVEAGETFALLGPNGAGKTTTVEMIEGYRRPDAGQIRVLGEDPATAGRDHRARVGLMLQGGGGVDPRMTAREVLRLHGRFHVAPRNADELL